ncbi:phosphoribosyltransferase-like protein [Lacrimispora sp.]|uniref:phosphoribosyltransferase-like protein n=1 Tax=Lacrimispora sp. TaxID=2719234 RepID=UPI0028B22272|nr:hypothetical protein [Lacrimispora sp.]
MDEEKNILDDKFMECISRWAEEECDDRLEKAISLFDEWESKFSDSEKEVVAGLISNYNYYSKKKVIGILKELDDKVINTYNVSNNDSIVSVIRKKNGLLGSSSDYWLNYSYLTKLSGDIFYDSLDYITPNQWKNIKNIIFVDDCSGTGETIKKFLERQKNNFSNKQIIIILIEMMEDAYDNIMQYAKNKKLNVKIIPYYVAQKAFFKKDEKVIQKYCMTAHNIAIKSKNIFGYAQSEALMSFYNNSPNNTLGIFWEDTEIYNSIFPRKKKEKAGWKNNDNAIVNRRKQQYFAKKRDK